MKKLLAGLMGVAPGLSFAVSPLMADQRYQRYVSVPSEHRGLMDRFYDLCSSVPAWVWVVVVIVMLWGAAQEKRKK
ncbi:hypothetical protein [Burkholderia multivorans]|uniref:hypothetical protein n=1 Tax=Burkholderia multivorans TaxID=87883 RepID=UPI001C251A35|nr:hypothetical protein [Burkholderia multivorans]MBU9547517.1 hypothetical protein [Burkholderia multivorans]